VLILIDIFRWDAMITLKNNPAIIIFIFVVVAVVVVMSFFGCYPFPKHHFIIMIFMCIFSICSQWQESKDALL